MCINHKFRSLGCFAAALSMALRSADIATARPGGGGGARGGGGGFSGGGRSGGGRGGGGRGGRR